MKVTTQRDLIRDVASRWHAQYFRNGAWTHHPEIHARLMALDPETATAADVDAVIGNSSWTSLRCDECKADGQTWILMVGEEPDYESATARLCRGCVFEASDLADTY